MKNCTINLRQLIPENAAQGASGKSTRRDSGATAAAAAMHIARNKGDESK